MDILKFADNNSGGWWYAWKIYATLYSAVLTHMVSHFPDDFFKCIFLSGNVQISIKISLKFVPEGPVYNIPALVQIMAWRHPGDKPLCEPMMENLMTHICVTQPQWVNSDNKWLITCFAITEPIRTNHELHIKQQTWMKCELEHKYEDFLQQELNIICGMLVPQTAVFPASVWLPLCFLRSCFSDYWILSFWVTVPNIKFYIWKASEETTKQSILV